MPPSLLLALACAGKNPGEPEAGAYDDSTAPVDDTGEPGDSGTVEPPDGERVLIDAGAMIATTLARGAVGTDVLAAGNLGGDGAWLLTTHGETYALVPIPEAGTALVEDTSVATLATFQGLAAPLLVADLTGDGWDDLVVSDNVDCSYEPSLGLTYCQVAARLLVGPFTGEVSPTDARVTLVGSSGEPGVSTASVALPGDMDDDGTADLLMAVGTDILRVPVEETGDVEHRWEPAFVENEDSTYHLIAPGDLDGDGGSELVYSSGGATVILDAPLAVPATVADADAVVDAPSSWPVTGGDLDGDGYDDLVAARFAEAVIYYGPVLGGEAEGLVGGRVVRDEEGGVALSEIVVHDLDDDGHADLLIADQDYLDASRGAVYAFAGPVLGLRDLSSAEVCLHGGQYDRVGSDVDIVGGALPLAIGAKGWSDLAEFGGIVHLLAAPF